MAVSTKTIRRWMLPVALGVSDGILNALILASAVFVDHGKTMTLGFAARVGCVALVTAVFTMFVAEYADLRAGLAQASRQLNLSASGRLATTHLGQQVRRDALQAAAIAGLASFVGAVLPLALAAAMPSVAWMGLAVAVVLLGALGVAIAASVGGNGRRWSAGLIMAGAVVAVVGVQLRIT